MDWWILKQLRAMILTDLHDFVPHGYFESEVEEVKLCDEIKNSNHFSRELKWGYLAAKLGKRLFFDATASMSARQVSASEVLMNLGMLVSVEVVQNVSAQLSVDANVLGVLDCNAGLVSKQLELQHIPTLSNNVMGALEQYLHYLTPLEAKPFISLINRGKHTINIENIKSGEEISETTKVINNTINISGSINGDLQAGETNTTKQTIKTSEPKTTGPIKWVMDNIVGVAISSLIVAAILSWLGLSK